MKYIVVGFGNIGNRRKELLGNKCVATVDPNVKSDYEDIIEVPLESFDSAILSVPNSEKVGMMKYFLSFGKNVLVEKPLIIDEKTVSELLELCTKNDCIWYTSYNHRFEPSIQKLKEYLPKIGILYYVNFVYGNGTSRNVRNTWRDCGHGVLDDLGCHLIDLSGYLFGDVNFNNNHSIFHENEINSPDYCRFTSSGRRYNYECSYLMWKNTFKIDVYGEKGSIHIDGLQKWRPSSFVHCERVYPSGVPREITTVFTKKDETWEKDIEHFEEMVKHGISSFQNDLYISESIKNIGEL